MRRTLRAATSGAVFALWIVAQRPADAAPIKATAEKSVTSKTTTPTKKGERGPNVAPAATRGVDQLPAELRGKAQALMQRRLTENLAKIGKLRDDAERLLESFIAEERPDSPDLPEALLKLAELKYERAREKFAQDFAVWEKKPAAGRGPAPTLALTPSRKLVGQVLDHFPTYREYDLALYLDAALAGEEGNQKDALARFQVILAKYPSSRFAPDAHMAAGEDAFEGRAAWGAALVEYEKVLEHAESELYGLAMFKSAWCLWKLGRQDDAAKRFTKVLEVTSAKSGASMAKRQALESLEDEALKALVDVFIEDEATSAQDVYAFLMKIGGERFAGKIVRKLAEAYEDNARYKREVEAYELLRKLEPTSPEGTDHMLAIARAWAIEQDDGKQLATFTRILDEHLPPATITDSTGKKVTTSGTWAKTQLDPKVLEQSTAKIESEIRNRAVEAHARGQSSGNKNDFALAQKLYQLYLTRFREHPNAYDVLFYVAEVEYHRLGQDSEAARDYLACAKLNPKGGLSRDALFNALSALERLRAKEIELAKAKGAAIGAEETETDKRFAEALTFYAQSYPNDPDIPGFLLTQGTTYYDNKVYDPAIRIFGELLTRYPASKEANAAGDRMIDSLVHAKDFQNVETWARKLKTLPAYAGDANQKRLDGLIVQAVFKQGEGMTQKGEHAAAAAAYLRAAKEFPKDERASKACVNAIIAAKTAGELGIATSAADLALNEHKNTPEAPLAAWTIAESLRSAGLLSDAAAYDERLVREYPKDSHTRDAAFNAVVTRVALGDYGEAVHDAADYMRLFPAQNDDSDEVTFLLGQAHEKAKKWEDAAKVYAGYVLRAKNLDHKVEAWVRLAKMRVELKESKGADEALKQAVTIGTQMKSTLKEGRIWAAEARYLQGERLVAQYDAITLDVSGAELKKRLDKKKDLLKQAGSTYAECAKMGAGEWTTAALYRIGYVFEGFANALKGAKPPPSASQAEQDAFHEIVDPIAEQFVEKAIDAYETGWKKAIELKIFNRWTAEMRQALSRLNDVEYPPLREIGFDVRSAGPTALPEVVDAPILNASAMPTAPKPAAAPPPTPPAPAAPATKGKK